MSVPLRILIIDDSEDDTLLAARLLQQGGYDLTFQRVDSALQMRTALKDHSWDVIIADYSMPGFNGLDALNIYIEFGLDFPFIIVSGTIGEEIAVAAMKAGAHDYVMKDNLARLVPAIERELREAENRRERRQAIEALRESEARFRAIFETAKDPIFLKDHHLKYAQVNPAMESLFGMSASKMIDQTDEDIFGQELGGQLAQLDVRVLAGEVVQEECTMPIQGVAKTIHVIKVPMHDSAGRVSGLCGIARDITERKLAEEEIRRRNQELALLNRVIAASAASLEPEAILDTVCRELAQTLAVPQAGAVMLTTDKMLQIVAEYISPDVEERLVAGGSILHSTFHLTDKTIIRQLVQKKAPLIIEDIETHPGLEPLGELLYQRGIVSLLLLPLIVEEEVAGGLILADMNQRRFDAESLRLAQSVADQVSGALARARLYELHRRLSTAIQQAAESVIITDDQGTILYVNPAFEQISGFSQAEAIGQKPNILKSGKQGPDFYRDLWACISSGRVWHGRFTNKRKDGTVYVEEATITPIRDENKRITNYVSVKRDITRELELEDQYRQAQKMEAVGRLAAGIAHDFNNLLTAINGFTELMQKELPPGDPLQDISAKVLNSGQRAATLVRQLLAFSRKQVVTPRIIKLDTVVSNIDKMLRRIIGEDITLETRFAPNLWSIKADPSQIEQIVLNLAINARDAMPAGGQLTIETSNVTLDEAYVSHHLVVQSGDHVLLSVSDTGVGMDDEVVAHIFEPFFTTKDLGKGTGLGLATVFGIVKQSKGHIQVKSQPGQGTIFKIYFPRVMEEITYLLDPDQVMDLPKGRETILLVEDETMVRDLAAYVLRGQGYTVLEADNGQSALQVAQQHQGKIDLLLTDVIMPHMDGKTLADQLIAIRPDLKILFASGYSADRIAQHNLSSLDGTSFVQKPFSPRGLANKVRDVLDSHSRPGSD